MPRIFRIGNVDQFHSVNPQGDKQHIARHGDSRGQFDRINSCDRDRSCRIAAVENENPEMPRTDKQKTFGDRDLPRSGKRSPCRFFRTQRIFPDPVSDETAVARRIQPFSRNSHGFTAFESGDPCHRKRFPVIRPVCDEGQGNGKDCGQQGCSH